MYKTNETQKYYLVFTVQHYVKSLKSNTNTFPNLETNPLGLSALFKQHS